MDALRGLQSGHIRIGTFSSVATHWLPYILRAFSHDYPGIDYELLLGDYCEVEDWLTSGRVDCGFVRLPTRPEFTTIFLQRDDLAAVLPADHPLAAGDTCPVQALGAGAIHPARQGRKPRGGRGTGAVRCHAGRALHDVG